MKKRALEGLLRKIGTLKPANAASVQMNKRSLSSVLTKIKQSKRVLNDIANDESLLFRVFIEGCPATWKNDEGKEITTSLESFLTNDDIEEIIEERQTEVNSHIDRLTALEHEIKQIVESPIRKNRRERIRAALQGFAICSEKNADIKELNLEGKCPSQHSTILEVLISRIISSGTGSDPRKGTQSAKVRERDNFVVNSGRRYYKKHGVVPAISRNFVTTDAMQIIDGPFVRHAMADTERPKDLNPTKVAESVRRIKTFMKETPDHPAGFSSKSRAPQRAYSSIIKHNK